jgi:malate dehydrogenase
MQEVAILGAGELGGALAHLLARRDITTRIQLIDPSGQIATGKALDIMQAAPIEGFSTQVAGATDIAAAMAAQVVVLADSANRGEWTVDDGLGLLQQTVSARSSAVVVCAGASHRELIERAVQDARIRRGRIVGSSPEALASAVRALVAVETNGSPRDVMLTVLGIPPGNVVVPWDDVAIAGFTATRMLEEPARRRVAARIAPLWPPGPYALAHAACEVLACVLGRSRRIVSCFVASDDGGGIRSRTVALSVRLDDHGVANIERPALSGSAKVALDNATLL